MGLMTKEKIPSKPEEALEVLNARQELAKAIAVQERARAERDALRRTLAESNAPPADKIRARARLPAAETEVELAEVAAAEAQNIETARLQEAVEAWRPVFEGRFREALRGLYEAFDKHAIPANEGVRRVWLEAYQAGIELPVGFWTELIPTNNAGAEPLLAFRRRCLRQEAWLL